MKKLSLLALLLLPAYSEATAQGSPASGTATPVRSIAEFRTIDVTDGIQLYIQDGRETSVRVEASPALREQVRTVVEGAVLRVYLTGNESGTGATVSSEVIKVYVTSTGLNSLKAAKGALVSFDHSPTRGGTLAVHLLSGARLAGDINVTLLDVQLGGNATARFTGAASNLHVRANERSHFQSPGLRAKRCQASAAGGSAVDVTVEQSLAAEAVGDAVITYSGSATLTKEYRAQGGKIRRI